VMRWPGVAAPPAFIACLGGFAEWRGCGIEPESRRRRNGAFPGAQQKPASQAPWGAAKCRELARWLATPWGACERGALAAGVEGARPAGPEAPEGPQAPERLRRRNGYKRLDAGVGARWRLSWAKWQGASLNEALAVFVVASP